ncbi:MAG: glycosyltransferase [Holophagales bacterium]|nr:glycosyltransferase [Holophagales bacterium]
MLGMAPPTEIRDRWMGRFWAASLAPRRRLRGLRTLASRWLYGLRHRLRRRSAPARRGLPPRVLEGPLRSETRVEGPVTIALDPVLRRRLAGQTEPLLRDDSGLESRAATHHLFVHGDARHLPAAAVEGMLLMAATCQLDVVIAEVEREKGDSGAGDRRRESTVATLLRDPAAPAASSGSAELVGRRLDCGDQPAAAGPPPFPLLAAGPYLLRPDVADGRQLVHRPLDPARTLASPAAEEGPRTALFLLPFLAVGGAERLLFDLLEGLACRYRLLVVTLDPHREAFGCTIRACRRITPHVYPLGDWLPREARVPAVRLLLRRWRVETLVSWNGTVDFFDHLPELRRAFPELRIASQLYHHRGGYASRTSGAAARAVDLHLAVNRDIARALVREHGLAESSVALVHHGVAIPERPSTGAERTERRRLLGIDRAAVVVGSFLRFHDQKRPLDILELARRFRDRDVIFLLVGGGPLDGAIDAELTRRPIPNLRRLPMTLDPLPLYDALDVCLMTSEYEGLPVFLLDGLARGLPAVAPAVGDIPLLLGEPGAPLGGESVARPGDLDALEGALHRLLDPEARAARGREGRRIVEQRFALEPYRRGYEALLFPEPAG